MRWPYAGSFDVGFLRCLPNMVVMTPADENETRQMLYTAIQLDQPSAVRYPRGTGPGVDVDAEMQALPVGKAEVRREGNSGIAILAFGPMLEPALEAADELDATVVNMRYVKPMDVDMVMDIASRHELVVTVPSTGWRGQRCERSACREWHHNAGVESRSPGPLHPAWLRGDMLRDAGLTKKGLLDVINARCESITSWERAPPETGALALSD